MEAGSEQAAGRRVGGEGNGACGSSALCQAGLQGLPGHNINYPVWAGPSCSTTPGEEEI